jgi:AraC-like DNA-binding protein/mannose-6-phosphate isomerase-like protein (cupin superfamily)
MPTDMAKRTTRDYTVRLADKARIIDPDRVKQPAFVLLQRYETMDGPPHQHRKGQLFYAHEGVVRVETDSGSWIVPPQRGVWLPPGFVHRGVSQRSFTLCTLYLDARLTKTLPKHCCTVAITPLVRELLLRAATYGWRYPKNGPRARLLSVLIEQLPELPHTPLHLPEPADRRLRTITAVLREKPASNETLDELSQRVGASSRTLARLFVKETGLTFALWRQQLRLLVALEMLAHGQSVTATAFEVGYQDVSAFIGMFRDSLGVTPGHYFETPSMRETKL